MDFLGLDHVQLAAPPGCEREARRFFGALLELEEVPKPPSLQERGGLWFQLGPQQLHIGVTTSHFPAMKAHPAIRVTPATLAELAQRLSTAGEKVEWDELELPGVRRFYTADPWGNRIEVLAIIGT